MAQQADTVFVNNFGITENSFEDATIAVQKAIAFCKQKSGSILFFAKGRYDFWPQNAIKKAYYISNTSSETEVPNKLKTIGLFFEGIKNVTVDGNGAEFIFHGKMTPLVFMQCQNMHIQNVQIDFERPTMSEMTFTDILATSITAKIHPDSKFKIINNQLKWYGEGWGVNNFHAILVDTITGVNTYSSWDVFNNSRAELIAPQTVKFTGDFSKFKALPGEVLTIRDPIRDEVGSFINLSKNLYFKNVHMYYLHGLGVVSQFCENLYFDSIMITPQLASGRVISGFADALHFSSCRGEIKVENSNFKGLHDDPINVHGTHLQVTAILSATKIRIAFMHPQTYGFAAFFATDSIAFVHSQSLQIFGKGIIKSAKLISSKTMEVEFMKPYTSGLVLGDCLENLTWTPSFTLRNCRFESTNTRGLLVTTRKKVLIEGNLFYRTGMYAILIGDDATSWYESGPVQDVEIRNNIFEECGYNLTPDNYVIAIAPENHQLVKDYYVHQNISIENNVFKIYDRPLLKARSVDGLVFSNNIINPSTFLQEGTNKTSTQLNACKNVRIQNNIFNTAWKPVINLTNMKANEVNTDIKGLETGDKK